MISLYKDFTPTSRIKPAFFKSNPMSKFTLAYSTTLLSLSLILNSKAALANTEIWQHWLQQHSHTVQASPATQADYDWRGVDAALKGVKLVLLDEQSHGEENVFALKAELVKHLHQKHGYDVLVMESGVFDLAQVWQRMQQGQSLRQLAPGNLFYLYAKSPAVLNLLDYLEQQQTSAHPLQLAGMDSQHTGRFSRELFIKTLAEQAGILSPVQRLAQNSETNWDNFSKLAQALLELQREIPPRAAQAAFFKTLAQLQRIFAKQPDPYWRDICASLGNQARRYWGLSQEQRSPQMARNLLHLLTQRYAGKKVIVWGHFVHLNRSGLAQGGNVGALLAQHYGQQMYVAHFTGNQGEYYNFLNDQLTKIAPMPFKTIENLMAKQTGEMVFANWRALPRSLQRDQTMQAALHSYLPDRLYDHPNSAARWQNRIDGSFYLRQIHAVTP